MYQRVMVPLDGSPFGDSAIATALDIARRTGAIVDLVHVHVPVTDEGLSAFTPYQYQHVTDRYAEWDEREREEELVRLREKAAALAAASDLEVTGRVVTGAMIDALLAEAERFRADVIVMATHARTGFDRMRHGSVADLIVRHADMPVLLLQPAEGATMPLRGYRRVLVPMDGSTFSASVLKPALAFARLHDADIRLVHVLEPDWGPDPLAALAADLPDWPIETVRHRDVAIGILREAETWGADLIALATHGRGGLSRVVTGSTATRLLAHSHLPMLLQRPGSHAHHATVDVSEALNGA